MDLFNSKIQQAKKYNVTSEIELRKISDPQVNRNIIDWKFTRLSNESCYYVDLEP